MTQYPDISDIIARKQAGRKSLASKTLSEKIEMVEAAWERLEPFKQLKESAQLANKTEAKDEIK